MASLDQGTLTRLLQKNYWYEQFNGYSFCLCMLCFHIADQETVTCVIVLTVDYCGYSVCTCSYL